MLKNLTPEVVNSAVYVYWKEKEDLVSIEYAKKIFGVGDKAFYSICQKYNLVAIEKPAPFTTFTTKLYNLEELYRIKTLENELNKAAKLAKLEKEKAAEELRQKKEKELKAKDKQCNICNEVKVKALFYRQRATCMTCVRKKAMDKRHAK